MFPSIAMYHNNSIKHQSFVYTVKWSNSSISTIQFSTNHLLAISLNFNHFYFKCQIVLFDSLIGPFQVLPLRVRVGVRAMAMKGPPHSLNLQGWSLSIRWFNVLSGTLFGAGFYSSADIQSMYSTVQADWASHVLLTVNILFNINHFVVVLGVGNKDKSGIELNKYINKK